MFLRVLNTPVIAISLNNFNPIFQFYTLGKRQKSRGFLTFAGGIEIEV